MLRLQDTKTGKFTLWRCIVRSSQCSDACYAGLAEAALGEGSGVKLHKLSVKELKAEEERVKREWEDALSKQIQELRTGIQRAETETSTAGKTAQYVSAILRSYYACACVFFISNVHVCSMFCAHAPFTGTSRTSCRGYEVSSGPFRVRQPKKTMTEELA